jgi:hypothetical protein
MSSGVKGNLISFFKIAGWMTPYNYPYAAAGFTLYANALYNPNTSIQNASDSNNYEQPSNSQFYPSAQQLIDNQSPSDESSEPPQYSLPQLNTN